MIMIGPIGQLDNRAEFVGPEFSDFGRHLVLTETLDLQPEPEQVRSH